MHLSNPTAAPIATSRPRRVAIQITQRCQLRCRHCFVDCGVEGTELPFGYVCKVIDEIAGWGVRSVRLGGGEPTWHRRFQDIVSHCDERGVSVHLNTHGVYAPELLEWLITSPVEIFIVSLDGLEAHHDALRGRGVFRRTVATCQALVAAGRRVVLGCHLSRETAGTVDGLIDLAISLGCDLKLSPIRAIGRGAQLTDVLMGPKDWRNVARTVAARRSGNLPIRVSSDFDVAGVLPTAHVTRGLEPEESCPPGRTACPAGRSMINVNFDGRIYPCAFFATPDGEFAAGTISETTLAEAWESPAFDAFRIHTKAPECLDCRFYAQGCWGGCPATAYWVGRPLDALDPMCWIGADS
ncbi:MAG: radical SAM protein [Micrococcales bacterium]|nr:radical SAM protein [Micrococcales bacterium]